MAINQMNIVSIAIFMSISSSKVGDAVRENKREALVGAGEPLSGKGVLSLDDGVPI